jgi:hypothetical protein
MTIRHEINRYRPTGLDLPKPGDILELVNREGKVLNLGRVTHTDPVTRNYEIEILDLDNEGRERTK